MALKLAREESPSEEDILIDRLVRRQGMTRDEAGQAVEDHKQGRRVEIDPALLIGLETL